ncbi:hypothetical protein Tco_0710395 [Tanacetum coccineum]
MQCGGRIIMVAAAVKLPEWRVAANMDLPPRDRRREVHRVQVFDFGGLLDLMAEGLSARMLMEHRDAQGVSLFTSWAWRRLFEFSTIVHEYVTEPSRDLVKEISTNIGEEFTNMEILKCWSLETSRRLFNTRILAQLNSTWRIYQENIRGVSHSNSF